MSVQTLLVRQHADHGPKGLSLRQIVGYPEAIARQKSKSRMLVAESPRIRRLVAAAFQQAGFATTECEPGQARTCLANGGFALLVTNWPSHVTDEELGVPVIYLSSDPGDLPDPMPLRARAVRKPLDVGRLLSCARQLLTINPAGLRKPTRSEQTQPTRRQGGASA